MIERFLEMTMVEVVLFSTISTLIMLVALILIKVNTKKGYQPKDELDTTNPPRK